MQALLSFSSKRKMIQKLAGGAAGSMPHLSKANLLDHKIEVPPPNIASIQIRRHRRKSLIPQNQRQSKPCRNGKSLRFSQSTGIQGRAGFERGAVGKLKKPKMDRDCRGL
jgi:hypothetical protein